MIGGKRFNFRRTVLYLVIVCLACFSLGIGITIASGGNFIWDRGETFSIQDQKNSPIQNIKNISVDVSSAKVNIISESRDDVKAELSGTVITSGGYNKPELNLESSGDTLKIEVIKKQVIGFVFNFSSSLELNVYVPSNYGNAMKIESSSGSINISNLKLEELKCSVSSGSVILRDITAKNFSYNGSSGGLNAENLFTDSSSIRSSSGSIKLTGFKGSLNSSSSSGSTYVEYAELNGDVDIHASSGRVELKLPKNSEFSLKAGTSSGSINCAFPLTVSGKINQHSLEGTVGSGKNKINLECSSGGINIEF